MRDLHNTMSGFMLGLIACGEIGWAIVMMFVIAAVGLAKQYSEGHSV